MSDRSEAALLPTASDWDTIVEAASLAAHETRHDCTEPNHSIDNPQILNVTTDSIDNPQNLNVTTDYTSVPTSRSFPLTLRSDLGLSRSTFSEPCGLQINAHDAVREPCALQINAHDVARESCGLQINAHNAAHEPCGPQINAHDMARKANAENKQTLEHLREETASKSLVERQKMGNCPLSDTKVTETYGGDTAKQVVGTNIEVRKPEASDSKCGDRRCPVAQRNECCLKSKPHSPARFLECCLAAEDGARVSFTYPYLKNQPEVFVCGQVPDQNAGDRRGLSEGSSLQILNNGAQPCSCAMSTGGDNNLNVDGLLSSKICHGKYGDIRVSDSGIHSEGDCCRICQEDGTYEKLISPCYCSGTVGFMHLSCLETWLGLNGRTACELCLFPFPVVKIQPSIWQFFKRPLVNMDFASLLCDIACFCVLTPLLVASTYLCSMGVSHYQEVGKTGSVFAIVTLMVSLIAVYISWAVLAILYHRRVFMTWRERTARIRMWTDKTSSPAPTKMPDVSDDSVSTTHSRMGSFASRRLSGTSILLKPILWYSGSLRSQRLTSRTPFDQDVNSNRQRNSQGERNDGMNRTFGKTQRARSRQPCSCCSSLRPDLKLCPFLSKPTLPPLPSCLDVHSLKSSPENGAQCSVNSNP